jgi:S-DNA-T family DNA segregation ATPase FtsK/SpoIIIE
MFFLKNCLDEIKDDKHSQSVILGIDENGEIIIKKISELKNILISGNYRTGKSTFIDSMLFTLISKLPPEELRIVVANLFSIDLDPFEYLPHLFDKPSFNAEDTLKSLRKCIKELRRREKSDSRKPYLIITLYEFVNWILYEDGFRESVEILAERGPDVGIYLILSTMRPLPHVVTDKLRGAFDTRILFASDEKGSLRILEEKGGETLEGNGQMLYKDMKSEEVIKIQAPYIWPEDLKLLQEKVTDPTAKVSYEDMKEFEPRIISYDKDPLYYDAKKLVIDNQKASPSYLQRKLRIGYNHAARLIEELEHDMVIGRLGDNCTREVFIKKVKSVDE